MDLNGESVLDNDINSSTKKSRGDRKRTRNLKKSSKVHHNLQQVDDDEEEEVLSIGDETFIQSENKLVILFKKLLEVFKKYLRFIGPGILVSVAYLDPGNYSTSVSAGFSHKYKLLFSILISNLLACFLQVLCIKVGSVTGLDLAQNCREHLPKKLNITIYILTEIAIIATDLAEVVGTAIALNILFNIPLIFGVILTVIDVLVVLMAYRPNGPMLIIRIFEGFVTLLVASTVICFAIELFEVSSMTSFKDVMTGFLPSQDVVVGDGLYLSLAILGATVMPHSLYLGSDQEEEEEIDEDQEIYLTYRPSLAAIRDTMSYSIAELVISLFTVALFVNSAILIVAGSTIGVNTDEDVSTSEADLFTIYDLLSKYLSKTAGSVYAAALLLSGQSAGIVCTLAGQMVSEGFLHWTLPPTLRRLLTRAVAITPCLILVLVSGRKGLSAALNASQVILSLLLPFVSAPLIYFSCNKKIMRVPLNRNDIITGADTIGADRVVEEDEEPIQYKDMSNGPITTVLAILVWAFISFLNTYLLISFAVGREVPV
ncbi:hypothetical protein PACTADRAFT_46042 [Pachysolen tannophilus NRRL Y-2460]|uniref:Uncharacterized protein n=1 Tax=Pachysolen tannophilus NRRL Y-2460 TaxID=669874 RepID=A0A1E4TPI2_PACTA|nr:hypothetical protein PACTADRAFT_46042 [Pachysolen tannophilus NRRL Y-2460]